MPTGLIVALVLVVLLAAVLVVASLVTVPEGRAVVLERGGKFRAVLGSGRHFVTPFVDKVRARIDLGPQLLSFPPHPVQAADGQELQAGFAVQFRIEDARLAAYEITNPAMALEQLTLTAVRQETALMTAERAIASPEDLHRSVWTVLHDTTPRWGITTVELELMVSPAAAPETPSTAQEWY